MPKTVEVNAFWKPHLPDIPLELPLDGSDRLPKTLLPSEKVF